MTDPTDYKPSQRLLKHQFELQAISTPRDFLEVFLALEPSELSHGDLLTTLGVLRACARGLLDKEPA